MTVNLSQLSSESLALQTYTPNIFGARFQDVFSPLSNVDPGASLKLVAVVPEASTWLMLSLGIGILAIGSRRNAKSERASSLSRSEA
jgi:hypothetical protein